VSLRRVVNASPIIFLHSVGLLEQLNEPAVTVIVPDAVLEELGRIPLVRPLIEELRRNGMRLSADLIRHVLDLAGE
jgi:predicted nucleic acid-binding protein